MVNRCRPLTTCYLLFFYEAESIAVCVSAEKIALRSPLSVRVVLAFRGHRARSRHGLNGRALTRHPISVAARIAR